METSLWQKITEVFSKKGMLLLLLGGITGIALILLGNTVFPSGAEKTETQESATAETAAYRENLESEMEELCSRVSGAGKTTCAVMLRGSVTYEYAVNSQTASSGAKSDSFVTVGSGSSESPVVVSVHLPEIVGVGIVCRGGDDAGVRKELISLISSAYGIGTNKIYVARGN